MMKKHKSINMLALALIITGSAQGASTGTLSFTGEMSATTCSASVNGAGPSGSVTLPTISISSLDAASKQAGNTLFTIQLSGCSGTLKTATASFEQVADGAGLQGAVIKNSGTAGSVGIVIYDAATNGFIHLEDTATQETYNTWYDISSGSATLRYSVRYYAFAATTPGTVIAKANYTLIYK
jgi:major type 1 subunit fimbrin (pilin)